MRGRKIARMTVLALLLGTLCACGSSEAEDPRPAFAVELLSTGKSDCAVISMDGLIIISDTADEEDYDAIAAALASFGAERIDYIILSHYDKDHIGSTAALLRNYTVGMLLRPDYKERSPEFTALMSAVAETSTPCTVVREDYVITTGHGSITVDPADRDYGDDNNNSMLTMICYEGHNLAFLGDAKKLRMEEFLSTAATDYDFIKLPHHGDSNKPILQLISSAQPRAAAATVSEQEVLEKDLIKALQQAGTTLYLTRDGTVRVTWDGESMLTQQITN